MTGQDALVLLVEDELHLRRFIRISLISEGYRVIESGGVAEALALARSRNPDLLLLDLGLPDGDGINLARQLRAFTSIPIIVLSARGQEDDKVTALDAGADDYLTKPFGVAELLARLRVAQRHARGGLQTTAGILLFQHLMLDLDRRQVFKNGVEIHLTPTEYKMLVLLASNADKVLTHSQILAKVWGPSYAEQSHYVRVHMAELRKKVELDSVRPRLIVTEPGVGYRFRGA